MSDNSTGGMIGARLRALRELRGFTQAELGALIGKDPRQIVRYEKDDVEAGAQIVKAFAYHLETTADYLLGLTDDPAPRLYEEELSDSERSLILALRQRRTDEAVQAFATLAKPS